jgi:nicastrin
MIVADYDWKSGLYSTWTESTWRDFSARIFLRPSWAHEAVTLAIGFVVMIISFVLVFLINSKSDILFGLNSGSPLAR